MRKTFISVIILLIGFSLSIHAQEKYDIDWKLGQNEVLAYKTIMEKIEADEFELPAILKSFPESKKGDNKNVQKGLESMIKSLTEGIEDYSMVSILQKRDEWIDIKMIRENFSNKNSKKNSSFANMLTGIQLRAIVNQKGYIQSFYNKNAQKNLVAVFFQLPKNPVKIGDKWSIDVNWITTDHNFECDSMDRINEVELLDIVIQDNDTIALLKYTIHEKIFGSFFMPFKKEESIETSFNVTYDALCEFSISSGRWKSYSGIYSLKSTGYQNAAYKHKYALVEENKIHKKIKKYLK